MAKWFKDGLRFECTQCGECCTGDGQVIVTPAEAQAMAAHLRIGLTSFLRAYTAGDHARGYLVASMEEFLKVPRCIFLDSRGLCMVHEVKPAQCRSFPFSAENVRDPNTWVEAARRCEGIGEGPLISAEEIAKRLREATS